MKQCLAVMISSLLSLAAGQALMASERDCNTDSFQADEVLALGAVRSNITRLHFLKNTDDGLCPAAVKRCREPDYLVGGNTVVIAARAGGFRCAIYFDSNDRGHVGWLPETGLDIKPPSDAVDWTGEWSFGEEHNISVKRDAASGGLEIEGDATFGGSDPGRVKRGAVNTGSFSARIKPDATVGRAFFAFTATGGETLPFDQGPETACRLRMRLAGPYLRADDNGECGGMGVTFSGFYHRVQ